MTDPLFKLPRTKETAMRKHQKQYQPIQLKENAKSKQPSR
jgi:hypothetical protein